MNNYLTLILSFLVLYSSSGYTSEEFEEIIVTGSHIKISNEQSSPVEIISSPPTDR